MWSLLTFSCARVTRTSHRGTVQALLMLQLKGKTPSPQHFKSLSSCMLLKATQHFKVSAGAKNVVKDSQEMLRFDILM